MLWGYFTVYGVGSLSRVNGRMNQYMYQEIFNVKLRETIENMPIDERNIVFQHDRDPKHMIKCAKMGGIATISSFELANSKFRLESNRKPMDNT